MNILVAQNIKELKFIISNKKLNNDFSVLPINLEIHTYCLINKISHINIIDLINNNFHKKTIIAGEKLVSDLDIKNLNSLAQKKVLRNFIRKRFDSACYLVNLIQEISKKNNVEKIIISGWCDLDVKNQFKSYIVSKIIKYFFDEKKINCLTIEKKNSQIIQSKFDLKIESPPRSNKKTVLFTSLGYNANRLILIAFIKKLRIFIFHQEKIGLFKKIFTYLLGIKILKFQTSKVFKHSNITVNDINFNFENNNYSKYLTEEKNLFIESLEVLKSRCQSIDKFIEKNKISLIVSSIARDYQGYFSEAGKKLNIPSICISHGTVSKSYDDYDFIYKKNICEGVFDGEFKYFSIQSKICEQSLKSFPTNKKNLITGNLIFADNLKNKTYGKKKLLYAVTLKDFYGLQLLGVELHCEFYENLKLISEISKENKLDFIVNLHPSISTYVMSNLKVLFPNLEFYSEDINKSLKKSFVTISYSSSVIEDSLMSNVPVILLDQWKRYKHCDAEINPLKGNHPIYYVNRKEDLLKSITTLRNSKNINYSKVSFGKNSTQNISQMFDKII